MSLKLLQKLLISIFTGTFLAILIIGISRANHNAIDASIIPLASSGEPSSSTPKTVVPTPEPVSTIPPKTTPKTTPITPPQKTAPPPTPTTPKTLEFTGATYQIPWGDVTVRITVTDKKITAISTPDYPNSEPSIYARPYLIEQALRTGNANIQGVSGATYASLAFEHSLESAITKAGANLQ